MLKAQMKNVVEVLLPLEELFDVLELQGRDGWHFHALLFLCRSLTAEQLAELYEQVSGEEVRHGSRDRDVVRKCPE